KGPDLAHHPDIPLLYRIDASKHPQKCRLAGAVSTNNSHALAERNGETEIPQRLDKLRFLLRLPMTEHAHQPGLQASLHERANGVAECYALNPDCTRTRVASRRGVGSIDLARM